MMIHNSVFQQHPATRAGRAAGRPLPLPALRTQRRAQQCRSSGAAAVTTEAAAVLPTEVWEMTAQAGDAVKASAAAGNKMHAVVVINPVNEKENRFTSTEAMDYPCRCGGGARARLSACVRAAAHTCEACGPASALLRATCPHCVGVASADCANLRPPAHPHAGLLHQHTNSSYLSNMKEFETLVGVTKEVLRRILGDASAELKVRGS